MTVHYAYQSKRRRIVDAEGEVLDVLVQSKRNKHAALKLMRKLLKKYAFAPERCKRDLMAACEPAFD
jgi:transposase-like protein